MAIELVGHLAGFLVAMALVPQVLKSWKTKSTKDISLLWNSILFAGLLLWVTYAWANKIVPLMIFGALEATMAAILLILKLKYK